jgi:ribosomal protein S18 acetylase RimI-like enzyme
MMIRALTPADAAIVREIRLRALQEHPSAFGSSYEEEKDFALEKWAERLNGQPNNISFGAFLEEELVGINSFLRNTHLKMRHRGNIVAMYTLPHLRGQGIGRALLQAAIGYARQLDGLEDITLAVTVGNERAKRLYEKMGFSTYSYEPRFLRIDDHYFDLEWMILSLATTAEG